MVPAEPSAALLQAGELPLAVEPNGEQYLQQSLAHLTQQLETVNRLAAGELPDASLTAAGLKITSLDAAVPDAAQALHAHSHPVDEALLPYLSPLGWGHINLTGDYSWRTKRAPGKFQSLQPLSRP